MYPYTNYTPYNQYNYNNNNMTPLSHGDSLIKVTGVEGAKNYNIPPQSRIALFDANSDIFYVKTTDSAGIPTYKVYEFKEMDIPGFTSPMQNEQYVTKNELKGVIEDVKLFIRQQLSESSACSTTDITNKTTITGEQSGRSGNKIDE